MKALFIFLIVSTLLLASCNKEIDPSIACTEEFRYISIEIEGDTLTEFYTVRRLNADTIRPTPNRPIFENNYEVLSDSYSTILKGKSEQFQFIGVNNDSTIIKIDYEIGADECHIFKVSGPSLFQL